MLSAWYYLYKLYVIHINIIDQMYELKVDTLSPGDNVGVMAIGMQLSSI